ncbi:MAG TPA: TIGR03621 family F420-dependent LLM class oxidoreductase [Dehalococcoidia bacterium]|nr:TIGR03621 family F420-dependent LLM class oxidoreductase [Dehalococcoidia bacterium]
MANDKKIRFGIALGFPETLAQWQDQARKVEDLGYDVLQVADHLGRQWSPLLALQAAAQVTTRLRFGTQVIANDFRHPVVLAKEIATLDLLTGGRFEPGIGVGHPQTSPTGRSDYAQLGREMGSPGERVDRLRESLQVIKAFMANSEPFEYPGKVFNLSNVVPFPKPLQRPHPPIMVAGAGPRMLRLAAREANIINIAPRPPIKGTTSRGSTGFGLDIHGELDIMREAAGDHFGDLELCVFGDRSVITDKPAEEKQKLADDFGIGIEALDEMPHTVIGSAEAIGDKILLDRERYGISYRIVLGAQIDAYAPIVKRLSGK